jgi:uncharacterized membrane protein
MMILFLLIIGIAIYILMRKNEWAAFGKQAHDKSVEILKQRYVNGEIDDEEYKRMSKMPND